MVGSILDMIPLVISSQERKQAGVGTTATPLVFGNRAVVLRNICIEIDFFQSHKMRVSCPALRSLALSK